MSYNDSKEWLDAPEQVETIQTLIEIVKSGGSSSVVYDNSRDALYYQQYISNIRHGVQIHYPQYSAVVLAVRTWRTNDYDNARFTVNVGIPSPANYTKPRIGRSQRHRRLPPPTAQGRHPVPLRDPYRAGNVSGLEYLRDAAETPIDTDKDPIVIVEDLVDDPETIIKLATGIMVEAREQSGDPILLFKFTNTKITKEAGQAMMEVLTQWTVEDFTMDDFEFYTSIFLRRLGVDNG